MKEKTQHLNDPGDIANHERMVRVLYHVTKNTPFLAYCLYA